MDVVSRISGERLVLLGWSRAILLQLAHPLVAAGVGDHSGFRASPLAAMRRLRSTTRAMLSIALGGPERRARAIAGIAAIHRRVHGTLREPVGPYPAGTEYSANDPALLRWVHLTVVESTILAYERFVGALDQDDCDRYCAVAAQVAVELGAHAADIPQTWEALRDAIDTELASSSIAVGAQAREVAAAVLHGSLPSALAPAGWMNAFLTLGQLPSAARAAYGFSWSSAQQRRFDRASATIRRVRGITPARLARFRDGR